MTRFKEGARIETAINSGDPEELNWAKDYCEMRVEYAPKNQRKYWRKLLSKIEDHGNSRNN
jgi:hypothetical protein